MARLLELSDGTLLVPHELSSWNGSMGWDYGTDPVTGQIWRRRRYDWDQAGKWQRVQLGHVRV